MVYYIYWIEQIQHKTHDDQKFRYYISVVLPPIQRELEAFGAKIHLNFSMSHSERLVPYGLVSQ